MHLQACELVYKKESYSLLSCFVLTYIVYNQLSTQASSLVHSNTHTHAHTLIPANTLCSLTQFAGIAHRGCKGCYAQEQQRQQQQQQQVPQQHTQSAQQQLQQQQDEFASQTQATPISPNAPPLATPLQAQSQAHTHTDAPFQVLPSLIEQATPQQGPHTSDASPHTQQDTPYVSARAAEVAQAAQHQQQQQQDEAPLPAAAATAIPVPASPEMSPLEVAAAFPHRKHPPLRSLPTLHSGKRGFITHTHTYTHIHTREYTN